MLPHLRLALLVLLGLAFLRLLLCVSIARGWAARAAAAAVVAAVLGVMLFYYGLVLIGLHSWGRVVTWDLIDSYSAQVPQLADAIGISLAVALGIGAVACLALFAGAWVYLGYFDWAPLLVRRASKGLTAVVLLACAALWLIELYNYTAAPPTQRAEPVSLTFYPMEAAWDLQGHALDHLSAAKLDAAEDAARAAYQPNAAARRENLVLIVVDALRADHMGVYGYGRDTTPYLSRLDQAGRLRKLDSMRAACSSSACGLLSIMSSKFVHQLSHRPFTLQEALKRHGYRIHLLLSGDHTNFYNTKSAYGAVDTYFDGHGARNFAHMNDDRVVLDRLEAFPAWDGTPAMIQFHLMSTHLLGKRDGAIAKYAPSASYALPLGRGPAPDERSINFYDNGVRQTDAAISRLLATLARKGYLQKALVAITADHGESLGEHGYYQHGNSVREQVLHVPFLLLSYGERPTQPLDARVASQVDVAPTLLAELDLPRPRTWAGSPLQQPVARDFTYFQELAEVGLFDHRDPGKLWKYWVDSRTGTEYAFELSADPAESRNVIQQVPGQQKRDWRLHVMPAASLHTSRNARPSVR